MAKSVATVGFIALVFAIALFVGTRRTVMRGSVVAADLLPSLTKERPDLEKLSCPPEIPIYVSGTVFRCVATGPRTRATIIQYEMDRAGNYRYRFVDR